MTELDKLRQQARSEELAASNTSNCTPNDAPDDPHVLAKLYLRSLSPDGQPLRLRSWCQEFYLWENGGYRSYAIEDLRGALTACIRKWFEDVNIEEAKAIPEDGKVPKTRKVSVPLLGNVVNALQSICRVGANVTPPAWLDNARGPDPLKMLAVSNGILNLDTSELLHVSPSFFSVNSLPYCYEPHAPKPANWLRFLGQLWPQDPESVSTLQECFGLMLTPDTRFQKIFFLVGPKRSGKGTILRVLRALVGDANVAGPTIASVSGNFGLWPLLDKSVAIVSDARMSGRTDAATVVERLLSISGEDALTVDRKNLRPVTRKLSTRFVVASNELPRLGDASGALAGRLILLRMIHSFYDQEYTSLSDKLTAELPGILTWAIEGRTRLYARGRFVQPRSGTELLGELADLASPIGQFIREECVTGPTARVEVNELYRHWQSWCEKNGRKEPGTVQSFGRDLRAAVPTLEIKRASHGGERWREYVGIRIRTSQDSEIPPEVHQLAATSATNGISGNVSVYGSSDEDIQPEVLIGSTADVAATSAVRPVRPLMFGPTNWRDCLPPDGR